MVTQPTTNWFPAHPDNYTAGRADGIVWEGVVIHTTDGGASLDALGSWFASAAARASTHFGIGPDGRIGQFVSLQNTARGHGIKGNPTAAVVLENGSLNPNDYLIGIELVDNHLPGNHTPEQIEAAARLTAWLFATEILPHAARTGAAVSRRNIIGHNEIDSVNRSRCPSWPPLRWADFVARVGALVAGEPAPVDPRLRDAIDGLTAIALGLDDLAERAAVQAASVRALAVELAR